MSSFKNVAIVTSTFTARPCADYRFDLALQMCQTAKAFGIETFVVDGSPDPLARECLIDVGAIVEVETTRGMGASRRQCIKAGLDSGADVICWIEPEKVGMVPVLESCIEMVNQGYDIVVPWRNRLFADYPPYQALSEARANHEMAEITGRNLDLMSGPRIMSRRGAELLQSYQGRSRANPDVQLDDNWGILFIPVLWAIQDHMIIRSCPVDFGYPQIQAAIESRNPEMDRKRDVQRYALVNGMRKEAELIGFERNAV